MTKLLPSEKNMSEAETQKPVTDTLAPDAISEELLPTVQELGLEENCRQLAMEGWTVVENVRDDDFNDRFRSKIMELSSGKGRGMMLIRDPIFAEAIMSPKLLAMAEFSVGRGFLISQVAAGVRPKGAKAIGLHADNNWLPAPFPAHNMLLTGCWACDEFSREGGSTLVIPGSANLRRHPNIDERLARQGAIPIECPPGSVAMWDGNIWHANYPRTLEGERVVSHITYTRLAMRPVQDYSDHADDLVAAHGPIMSQLLGREDMLMGKQSADVSKMMDTFRNAKR